MKIKKQTIRDLELTNKTVILRLDLNVPLKEQVVVDDMRIIQSLPTLQFLLEKNCKIIVLSHLSRIKSLADKQSGQKSLKPVAKVLAEKIPGSDVIFCQENYGPTVIKAVGQLKNKQVLVLENTRYLDVNDQGKVEKKESKNDPEVGKFWASLGDVFINDAFGTAHRAHASNYGVAQFAKESAIGFLIERELLNLAQACDQPEKPFVLILGGAKVVDKLRLIAELISKVDYMLIGGGMAYTFQKAQGWPIGSSLCDDSMVEECQKLLASYPNKIILPVDNYVSQQFADQKGQIIATTDVEKWDNQMGLDIGPKTVELFSSIIRQGKTIIWNGPMGVFEFNHYQSGTRGIAEALVQVTAEKNAFTLIGGGDSAAAFKQLISNHDNQKVSFVSTGGGASLTYMEGGALPGIEIIKNL